jgi:phosphatidylserine/phosphatidylglycerophosphate/cardiolipin synthase-like enzyme
MYGQPGHLDPRHKVDFTIKTEKEIDKGHGIWFNRGAIASQAFARKFGNKQLSEAETNDPKNAETAWLSRGLLEACLGYIDGTPASDALRVCAYEFTYPPVLNALLNALNRGVDVQIIFHDTPVNEKAVATAKIPPTKSGKKILIKRTQPKIPHNKFIVRLKNGKDPVEVWTGSTNFTPSGFLGQTNVGHLVVDAATAKTYLDFWTGLSTNPGHADALNNAMRLTPEPPNVVPATSVAKVFSPRPNDLMLNWYGQRIEDAATSSMFTGAFGIDRTILASIAKKGASLRFILLERPPTKDTKAAESNNPGDILISYGAVLGQAQGTDAKGNSTTKRVPIAHFELDKWFLREELARRSGEGFVFFIHTKFLLFDPLSNDPLVCTGSANFSSGSLKSNDENMLLIRDDTRVADIYLTEFDRIFRHFYFRDVANEVAKKGKNAEIVFLDETGKWSEPYFAAEKFKNQRRQMFFADSKSNWTTKAASDPNVFSGKGAKLAKKTAKGSTGTKGRPKKPAAKKKSTKPKSTKRKTAKKTSQKKAPRKRKFRRLTGRIAVRTRFRASGSGGPAHVRQGEPAHVSDNGNVECSAI